MSDRVRFFRRKWPRRLLRGSIGLVVILVVGLLVTRAVVKARGEARVAEQVAALDAADPRWKWDEVEFDRMLIPDDENSALLLPEFEAALGDVPIEWTAPRTPGRRSRSSDQPPNDFYDQGVMAEVAALLDRHGDALAIAKVFADRPRGRHPLEFPADDYQPRSAHHVQLRRVAVLLDLAAEAAAHAGRAADVRPLVLALWNAAASLDTEPVVQSQLFRLTRLADTLDRVERTLALGVPPDDLTSLQGMFLAEARTDYFTAGVRGERAAIERFRRRMEAGELSAADWPQARRSIGTVPLIGPPPAPPDFKERVVSWARVGTVLPEDFGRHLEYTTAALRAVEVAEPEQLAALPPKPDGLALFQWARKDIAWLLEFQLRIRAHLRCAATALAVERFRLRHGRWPATLAEVPRHLLSAVPPDPFDGRPLRLAREPDGVTVYSVGPDRRDATGPSEYVPVVDDVEFRLYDPAERGLRDHHEPAQPVRPPDKDP